MPHEFTPSHEYAEIFPLHDENTQLEALVTDLKKKAGQRDPIIMFEGKVLDGRRRERACLKAGIKPKYKEFKGTHAAAIALVWSRNFPQRHLGEGERALCAARYAKAEIGANQHRPSEKKRVGQVDPPSPAAPTINDAAEQFKVSSTDVKRAKLINEHGCKELQDAVSADKVSLSDAAKVAKELHGMQVLALEKIAAGEAASLVAAVKAIKEHKKATKKTSLCPRCKAVGYRDGCIDCASIAEREKTAEPIVDDKGYDVPEELRVAFSIVPQFKEFNKTLTGLARMAKEIEAWVERHKKPLDPNRSFTKFHLVFSKARKELAGFRPTLVCQGCVGKNCQACRGHQWLSVEEVEAEKKANLN